MNRLLLGRHFDALDLFKFFDSALHLLGLCRLRSKTVDESFELFDPLALIPIGSFQLQPAIVLLHEELIVVAGVEMDTLIPDFDKQLSEADDPVFGDN